MPGVNLQITPQGPLIQVYVGASEPRIKALLAAGQTAPSLVLANFLIDTGATGTCVDPSILASLSLTPTGVTAVHTPSTAGVPVNQRTFDVQLVIPCPAPVGGGMHRRFSAVPVLECPLQGQGIDGLIGRDILASGVLIYNGMTGQYTLAL